jgi:hypothetical protein
MVAVAKNKKWDAIFKIFISETTRPIRTKLYLHNSWMTPFHIVSGNPDIHPTWPLLLKIKKGDEILFCFLVRILTSKGGEAYQASYVRKV